jgi:membrane protein
MYQTFTERQVSFMAGSVAFSAFLSLLPLFVLLFVVLAVVGDQALVDQVVAASATVLPAAAQDLLSASLEKQTGVSSTSIISILVLAWGALRLFLNLDTAFLEIYNSDADPSYVDKLVDSVVALGGLLLAIVAVAIASVALTFVDWIPYVNLLAPVVLVVGLTIAFLPIYYVFPNVDVSLKSAVPGAVVAAVGWTILQSLFQIYLSVGADSGGSGFLGGAIVILTWLYFSALIVLVGAVVNAVLSNHVAPLDVDDQQVTTTTSAT